MTNSQDIYEIRPRRLWYGVPNAITNAIGYAKFRSRSHDAVIRVYDESSNVIDVREHKGRFQRVVTATLYETQDCH